MVGEYEGRGGDGIYFLVVRRQIKDSLFNRDNPSNIYTNGPSLGIIIILFLLDLVFIFKNNSRGIFVRKHYFFLYRWDSRLIISIAILFCSWLEKEGGGEIFRNS